jgi:hypothetical protein
MELTDANGNSLEPQWMHLHSDGDAAGRSVTLTVEVCVWLEGVGHQAVMVLLLAWLNHCWMLQGQGTGPSGIRLAWPLFLLLVVNLGLLMLHQWCC